MQLKAGTTIIARHSFVDVLSENALHKRREENGEKGQKKEKDQPFEMQLACTGRDAYHPSTPYVCNAINTRKRQDEDPGVYTMSRSMSGCSENERTYHLL